MKKYKLHKSVKIEAPAKKVWDVLLKPEYFKQWAGEFSPGSRVKAQWKVGGAVCYLDKDGNGLTGRVVELEPNKLVTVEYYGEVLEHTVDPTLEFTAGWKGCKETYKLTEKNKVTTFTLDSEVPTKEFRDEFDKTWDRVLELIKGLAERQKAGAGVKTGSRSCRDF